MKGTCRHYIKTTHSNLNHPSAPLGILSVSPTAKGLIPTASFADVVVQLVGSFTSPTSGSASNTVAVDLWTGGGCTAATKRSRSFPSILSVLWPIDDLHPAWYSF